MKYDWLDEKNSKLGSELTDLEKKEVLGAYVHRFTGDNVPQWSKNEWKNGLSYPLQFSSDLEWLKNTRFGVTKKGLLSGNCRHCQSTPTWPNNPELRKK